MINNTKENFCLRAFTWMVKISFNIHSRFSSGSERCKNINFHLNLNSLRSKQNKTITKMQRDVLFTSKSIQKKKKKMVFSCL